MFLKRSLSTSHLKNFSLFLVMTRGSILSVTLFFVVITDIIGDLRSCVDSSLITDYLTIYITNLREATRTFQGISKQAWSAVTEEWVLLLNQQTSACSLHEKKKKKCGIAGNYATNQIMSYRKAASCTAQLLKENSKILTAIYLIQRNWENYPLLNQIYDILTELINQEKHTTICNISTRIGIKGNETNGKENNRYARNDYNQTTLYRLHSSYLESFLFGT